MTLGSCTMDLLVGNLDFPWFFEVRGPKPAFVLGVLRVWDAAGGKPDPQMTLNWRFGGRWEGASRGKIEKLKASLSQPGRPQRRLTDIYIHTRTMHGIPT